MPLDVKLQIHADICNELHDIYESKNHDYGDAFSKVRREYPEAIIIRLMDKLERLKTLYGGAEKRVNESIDDTLKDLANYCLLELVERTVDKNSDLVDAVSCCPRN